MKDVTKSYYALQQKINKDRIRGFDFNLKIEGGLNVISESNPKYVSPIFSIQSVSENTTFETATIVLISAAGATGKTALTNQLSYDLGIPIWDLSKHDPVASNSLIGHLINSLELCDFTAFVTSLKNGTSSMLIDAFDEAFLKTTNEGFYSFLDDIINIAHDSSGTPFVLLGRTNVMELMTLYLEEKGINVVLLQIEPFTEDLACEFIDNHVCTEAKEKHKQLYVEVRNFIIETIGGFFKNQSEINHKQYIQFLGYAPVLLAIATLLRENSNYQMLLTNLMATNKKNIDLIVDIIERILNREKNDKVGKLLLPSLLKGRDEEFVSEAQYKSYNIEEQCARLLYKQLGEEYNYPIMHDEVFDVAYSQQIGDWLTEHPFLLNGKIANTVFESYIISILVDNPKYKNRVFRYLKEKYTNAYMLFYIYDAIYKDNRFVDKDFVRYLYNSLCALDKKENYSSMELLVSEVEEKSGNVKCDLSFVKGSGERAQEYLYSLNIKENDVLSLGANISNITIDAPVCVELSQSKTECMPPVYIKCKEIRCSAPEVLLTPSSDANDSVVLECDSFKVNYSSYGVLPRITDRGNNLHSCFKIYSTNKLSYPFVQYHQETKFIDIPQNIEEEYHKMRRIILMFRSHSKGKLARYREKIDNRIGNVAIGKKVLDALISSGIICIEEHLYTIDNEKIASLLGIKYNDIRSCVINDKIKDFLLKIK